MLRQLSDSLSFIVRLTIHPGSVNTVQVFLSCPGAQAGKLRTEEMYWTSTSNNPCIPTTKLVPRERIFVLKQPVIDRGFHSLLLATAEANDTRESGTCYCCLILVTGDGFL
jgi:hypothetical protein